MKLRLWRLSLYHKSPLYIFDAIKLSERADSSMSRSPFGQKAENRVRKVSQAK